MGFVDLSGRKFGRLTVVRFLYTAKGHAWYECRCECGTIKTVRGSNLTTGDTNSCGCLHKELSAGFAGNINRTHGLYKTKLYRIWAGMKTRCTNPNSKSYPDYGGRSIAIYSDWGDFENFHKWATANGYEDGLEIDRIDNDGDYTPDNCRWVSKRHNANNRRTSKTIPVCGISKTQAEWEAVLGLYRGKLTDMKRKGCDTEGFIKSRLEGA